MFSDEFCQVLTKRETQRFKSGHKTCESEYRRFPHVYDYQGTNLGHPTGATIEASETLDFSGSSNWGRAAASEKGFSRAGEAGAA
jgi:hypothetical protein